MGALIAVTLAAYSGSFASGFVFDNRVLLQDPRITAVTAPNLRLILTRDYWYTITATGLYRPLATLSYLFNFGILGDATHPAGWHAVNFALHAANAALAYWLALLLLGEMAPALALAAVWALHPALTESVTNIIGRADLLCAFGVLAALVCHAHFPAAPGHRKVLWLAGLMLAAAAAVFSKEGGVVLPALMLLWDLSFRRPPRALLAGYLVLLPPFALFFLARGHALAGLPAMHIAFTDNPLIAAEFWSARLTAVKIIGKYLWLLLCPIQLSCDYSYNQVPVVAWPFRAWEDWQAPLALAACAGAVAVAAWAWRRSRPLFFFIVFFFIALAPTSNLVILIGSNMAERFLYLPSIGFAGCLVMAAFTIARRPRVAVITLACVALAFAARTSARNADWLDDVSLWSSAVETSPASYKAHLELASALSDPARAALDSAIAEVERAIAIIRPLPDALQNPAAYIDAGTYYGRKGESLEPRQPDRTIAASAPSRGWYRKALDSLLRAQRIEAANVAEERRLNLARGLVAPRPARWYELYLTLGAVYERLDQPRDALAPLQFGVRVRPVPDFFEKIASAYVALAEPRRAAVALIEALSMDRANPQYLAGLARLYLQIDPGGCSVRNGELQVDCPLVHADLCAASRDLAGIYRDAGMDAAALQESRGAKRLGCAAP